MWCIVLQCVATINLSLPQDRFGLDTHVRVQGLGFRVLKLVTQQWVDADWAGDTNTRRSHTGYILMMYGGPISWKSRRQDNVSLSTSEAEFVAASQAGQEALYLRETLKDFGYQQRQVTKIYEDNLVWLL